MQKCCKQLKHRSLFTITCLAGNMMYRFVIYRIYASTVCTNSHTLTMHPIARCITNFSLQRCFLLRCLASCDEQVVWKYVSLKPVFTEPWTCLLGWEQLAWVYFGTDRGLQSKNLEKSTKCLSTTEKKTGTVAPRSPKGNCDSQPALSQLYMVVCCATLN